MSEQALIQEKAVLGALMSGVEVADIDDILTPDMFSNSDNKKAFHSILDVVEDGNVPTYMTVSGRIDKLDCKILPMEYFAACVHLYKKLQEEHGFDVRASAVEIKEKYVGVRLSDYAKGIHDMRQNGETNTNVMRHAFQDLSELSIISGTGSDDTLEAAGEESLRQISEAYRNEEVRGVPWGFQALTRASDGPMQFGNMHGLLLDSGGGKTSLVMQIIRQVAEQNIPCLFFSYEQDKVQCMQQAAAQKLSIPATHFRRGEITDVEYGRITDDHRAFSALPIEVVSASQMNANDIAMKMMKFERRHGEGFCAIDHAKSIRKTDNRMSLADHANEMYTIIRDAAKKSNLATLVLMQRLRNALERENPAPTILDVYGGSAGQEVCDILFGMYRPEMAWKIKKDTAPNAETELKFEDKMRADEGVAWLYTLKNRYAEVGNRRKMKWIPAYTRFADVGGGNSMQDELLF